MLWYPKCACQAKYSRSQPLPQPDTQKAIEAKHNNGCFQGVFILIKKNSFPEKNEEEGVLLFVWMRLGSIGQNAGGRMNYVAFNKYYSKIVL